MGLAAVIPARASIAINVSYDASVPTVAQQAFNSVVLLYESLIASPVTVNLNVNFGSTGLGESVTEETIMSYSEWRNAMLADSAANPGNTFEAAAAASLPESDPFSGSGYVLVSTADAGALGFTVTLPPGTPDGTITFSNAANTFSYTGTATPGLYDFMSVAAHELDEVLGIGSTLTGVSDYGAVPTTLAAEDYFRYSAPGVRAVTTDPNAVVYFSYDGGNTDVAQFNQMNRYGDRNDWVYNEVSCTGPYYVQDAIGCPNSAPALGVAPETITLEALGWDMIDSPEPATLFPSGAALLALGAGSLFRAKKARSKAILER